MMVGRGLAPAAFYAFGGGKLTKPEVWYTRPTTGGQLGK